MEEIYDFARSRITIKLALTTLLVTAALCPVAKADAGTSISASFNSTAIAGGRYIWFTAVAQTSGLGSVKVTVFVKKSTITFTTNGTKYTIPAPDTNITFDPSATSATATFDSANNRWQITRPPSTSDNTLLSALQFAVPQGGLPGGITNVTWQLNLSTDTAGIGVKWKWAAAVYTSFSANYSVLGVKPVDDQKISQYQNTDHAGTPENYKSYVTGGATGSGGTNYVGLYSGTVTVSVPVVVGPAANAGGPYSGYAGQAISFNGTGSTDPNGYPLTYTWNFGDSNMGSGPTPSHTYSSAGTFTVTLTVSDGRNVTGTATTSATITLPPPPQISASQSPLPNANGWNNTSVSVTFTCVDSISGIYSCTPPVTVTSQGANQVVQGIAVNNAGESTTTSVKLNIDETAPTVTAVSAPPPNSNGWNNTNVAVSFSCSDSLSGVATCPSSQTVSAEGAGQAITGTATDNAGNSSSATVTLNIDHTSPVVSITSPANGAVFTSSAVTVSGTVSDALSGVGTLTCNGTMAVVSSGTFSCGLQMVSGSNAIQVQAVDLAGNSSNAAVTVTYNAVPPTELFITPTQASMLMGDVRTVNLVGQVGQLVSGATWNVSDPTVVSLSTDDPPQLTALAVGTTTLTASYGSLSATMTISVYTGTSLPAGTPIWSADPLPGNSYVVTIFPANPLNPGDPDLYSLEGNQTLRAFTVDGRQLWVSKITGPSTAAQSAQIAYASPVQTGELQGNPAPSTSQKRLEVKPSFAPGPWGTGQHNPLERIEQSHLRLLQRAMRRRSNSLVRGMDVSTGSVGIASATTSASYTPYTIRAVPLNDGGMLALVFNYSQTSGSPNYDSLIKMNSSGQPVWQRDSAIPGNFGITPAVGPDDTVYAVEYFITDMNTSNARVLALDGATGASKFTDNLPPNQVTVNGSQTYPGPAAARLFATPLSVMPDGSLQFVFAKYDKDYTGNLEALPNGPYCPSFSCQYSVSEHNAVLLYQIQPDGTMGTIPISQYDFAQSGCLWTRNCETPYFGELWIPEGVIPDGQGGTLASWYDTTVVTSDATTGNKVTHFDTSGNNNAFTIPLQRTWGYTGETGQNLVLGENNTAFATDSVGVTAFDINSGIAQWQWQPTSGDSISLLSANDPGGVTALEYDSNTGLLNGEISFDTSGTITGPSLASSIVEAIYFDDSTLLGLTATNQTVLARGTDPVLAVNNWSTPNGAAKSQRLSDPALVLVATQDCHKHNSQSNLYARYSTYNLRRGTDKSKEPDQEYTVFEFIPQTQTNCGVGGYNNLNPCKYADGSPRLFFNEFDDEISTGLSGGSFDRTQYFLYGLPNQRLWGVRQLYRTLPDGSLQLKQPNAAWNQLHAEPQADPLIDGHLDPWLAPWDGNPNSCNSTGSLYFPN